MSDVSANLGADGQLHANAKQLFGYVNSKGVSCMDGRLYWQPALDHKEKHGKNIAVSACDMHRGYLYRLPKLSRTTSFARVWGGEENGPYFICGLASAGDNTRCTEAVEVWHLNTPHAKADDNDNDGSSPSYYGSRELPSTQWQHVARMPDELWAMLHRSGGGACRMACVVGDHPIAFLVAEHEEEHMVVYDFLEKSWTLAPCFAILHKLFNDDDPHYYKVLPWCISFTPTHDASP